ncbi:hypothetical protein [Streptomyces mayteni]
MPAARARFARVATHAFARLDLTSLILENRRTPDGEPVTTLDIPGVRTVIV